MESVLPFLRGLAEVSKHYCVPFYMNSKLPIWAQKLFSGPNKNEKTKICITQEKMQEKILSLLVLFPNSVLEST